MVKQIVTITAHFSKGKLPQYTDNIVPYVILVENIKHSKQNSFKLDQQIKHLKSCNLLYVFTYIKTKESS